MTAKRDESDRIDRPDLTPTVSQVLRAVDEAAKHAYPKSAPAPTDDQKMSLFWRVFGGTLLSIAALVGVTLFNNFATGLSELRAELVKANEARATAVNDLRAEIARGADARAELVKKDEFNSRLTSYWTQIQALQAQNTAQSATLVSLRAELDAAKERITRQTTEADAARKEQLSLAEALKKDVAAVDSLREKLTAACVDLAAARDGVRKLTDEAAQNKAADHERKERRDQLQRQAEDAVKELTRAVGDCREKVARLEALVNPPAPTNPPPTPKKQ